MKKQDRALKAHGYQQTNRETGVVTESHKLANGHNIEVRTTTIQTTAKQKDGKGRFSNEITRHWSRSVIIPESTMRQQTP